jgi:hypothetical protein
MQQGRFRATGMMNNHPQARVDTQLQSWLQVKWVTFGKQTRINSRFFRTFGEPRKALF